MIAGPPVDSCRTGITYQQAAAHDSANPNDPWILRDSAGRPISSTAYAHVFLANVGSVSYQRQWATNVAGAIKRLGYNGTSLDNVSANISGWPGWSGVYPTLYPSASAWEPAMKSFIAYIGPQLKAQGLYVRASAGKPGPNDGSATKAWWTTLAPYVSGLMVEYFEQASDQVLFYNDPNNWHGYWESWLGLVDVAQNAGVDFYGGMKGSATDTGKMSYGKASFLMKWNGKRGGFFWQMNDASATPGTRPGRPTSAPPQPPATRSASAGAGTTPAAPCSSTPAPPPPRPSTSAPATKPPAEPASPPSPSNPPPP